MRDILGQVLSDSNFFFSDSPPEINNLDYSGFL